MSQGMQIFNGSGGLVLDVTDYTFRYVGAYSYTASASADVVVSISGVSATTHFAVTDNAFGFPVVESGQVRVKPTFSSGGGASTLYLYRI